jgi:hypothetical protein
LIRLVIVSSYLSQLTIEYLVPFVTALTLWLYTYVDGKSNNWLAFGLIVTPNFGKTISPPS